MANHLKDRLTALVAGIALKMNVLKTSLDSKADKSNTLTNKGRLNSANDFNTALETGIYEVSWSGSIPANAPVNEAGILTVSAYNLGGGAYATMQVYHTELNKIYYRKRLNSTTFSAWLQVASTASIPTSLPPNGAAGGDLSGTYPNPTVAKLNGQLPSYYLNYNNLTNQPTIPAQVSLTNGTGIGITGTYPNLTITNTAPNVPYTLPTASATVLGGIKVGSGLSIASGVLSATNTATGTVTSVALSVPTGLSIISGSPITSSGTIAVGLATGYSIPTIANQTIWSNKQDALGTSTGGKYLYQDQTWKQIQYSEIAGTPTITQGTQISITGANNTISFAPGGTSSQIILGDGSLTTLPTIGNATLTMNTSGIATGSQTFTANATSGKTFTVNVPGTNLGGDFDASTGQLSVTSSTGSTATISIIPLSSGNYNPTIVGYSGLAAAPTIVNSAVLFSQVGKIVTVSGEIYINISTGSAAIITIRPPIGIAQLCYGTVSNDKTTIISGNVMASSGNIQVLMNTGTSGTQNVYFTCQYQIQ